MVRVQGLPLVASAGLGSGRTAAAGEVLLLPFHCALQERLYNPEYQNFNVQDKQEDTILELFDLM